MNIDCWQCAWYEAIKEVKYFLLFPFVKGPVAYHVVGFLCEIPGHLNIPGKMFARKHRFHSNFCCCLSGHSGPMGGLLWFIALVIMSYNLAPCFPLADWAQSTTWTGKHAPCLSPTIGVPHAVWLARLASPNRSHTCSLNICDFTGEYGCILIDWLTWQVHNVWHIILILNQILSGRRPIAWAPSTLKKGLW